MSFPRFFYRSITLILLITLFAGGMWPEPTAAVSLNQQVQSKDALPKETETQRLELNTTIASMTEVRKIQVAFKFPSNGDRKKLSWMYGGKPLSEWKKFKNGGFNGDPFITVDEVEFLAGEAVAHITFGLPFDSDSLSENQAYRFWYPSLIGNHKLEAVLDGQVVAHTTIKLVPYDSYRSYDELKTEIGDITAQAAKKNKRYIKTISIGKSTEDRDIYMTLLAKNKAAIDKYEKVTQPAMLNNPEQLRADIQSSTFGEYQVPIWINNIHPDEAPTVDAIVNYFKSMALDESIVYQTTGTKGQSLTEKLDIDEALEHVIFIFVYTANPDGRAMHNRMNANGFDLNRDNSYQTQPETRSITEQIAKWSPLSFLDMHGFDRNFLIEPSTPPHNPNMEYDLLIEPMLEQAKAMGNAALGNTRYDYYHIPYEEYRKTQENPNYVSKGTSSGWDDASPAYTAVYAMHHGALGHTLEIPELNEESVKALYYAATAATAYVSRNKEELFFNQLSIYERGVKHIDDRAVDPYLVNGENEVVGRPRKGDSNFFPDYYVLPMDNGLQKNILEAHQMVEYLLRNGVRVERLSEAVRTGGTTYPSGSYVINMHQAKRAIANLVLGDGEDISDVKWVTGEIIQNFHDLRGFDRYVIRESDVFAGKTSKITFANIPKTQIPNQTSYVRIHNSNNDAIKAVNELLNDGKTVTMLTESGPGQQTGDFVVNYEDFIPLASSYYLEVSAYGHVKPTGKILSATKVAAYGEAAYVLKSLGFQTTDDQARADVLVNTYDSSEYVKEGKPFIAYGLFGMMDVQDWIPGFTYVSPENGERYEGVLLTHVNKDHVITGGYDEQEYFYSVSGAYITSVPEAANVLAVISDHDDFYKAGWWPGHETAKGELLAFTYEENNKHLTVFANDLTNNDHPQHQYRLLANSVYNASPEIADYTPNPIQPKVSFDDLQSVEDWAGDEIRELAERGIINGIAKNKFSPLEPVTRAEFLTMLVRAFHLPIAHAAVPFVDVGTSDWYYPHVAAAVEARVIHGMGGGYFGPNYALRPGDMALMANRILKEVEPSFIQEWISETRGSVESVNRAQAAVIISRMLQRKK